MAGPELLILARHAEPQRDPAAPPRDWPLTERGEEGALRMAELWRPLGIDLVVSSIERKAKETAMIVSDRLAVMFHTGHDLHEHERPYVEDPEEFRRTLRAFFDDERAHRAVERRFTAGVDAIVKVNRGQRLAIVAHGTVLALHLASRYGLDAWRTWQRLGMPAYAVVELRTKTVVDLVDTV